MGKRQSLQKVVLGKLDSYMQKNEIGTFAHTLHKKKKKKKEKENTKNGKNTEKHKTPRR